MSTYILRKQIPKWETTKPSQTRERLLRSAYELFSEKGISQVGVNTILESSGCAKASLYEHFGSKDGLAIAFLELREQVWTHEWLEAEILRRAEEPDDRLLAAFDVFDGWFRKKQFEGCSFVNVLLESDPGSPLHTAATLHLENIRAILITLAKEAKLKEPIRFAQTWHILMKGSIVSAREGNLDAACDARRAGTLVLQGWPRY